MPVSMLTVPSEFAPETLPLYKFRFRIIRANPPAPIEPVNVIDAYRVIGGPNPPAVVFQVSGVPPESLRSMRVWLNAELTPPAGSVCVIPVPVLIVIEQVVALAM